MSVSQGKKRRSITLSEEVWFYLEKRVNKQINMHWTKRPTRFDTVSCLIEEIVLSDKKVYEAFRTRK